MTKPTEMSTSGQRFAFFGGLLVAVVGAAAPLSGFLISIVLPLELEKLVFDHGK